MIVFIEIGIVLRAGVSNFPTNVTPPRTLKKGKENVGASEESKDKVKDLKEFKWRWLIKKQMLLLKLSVKSGVVVSSVDMLFGSKSITVLYNIYYLLVK